MKYDLTRLDLDDLDAALVAHLIAVGEPLHVERKRDIPQADKLSELMGSLANTEGGWAVLGVEDDGTVVGLQPSRTDLQDEIRGSVRKAPRRRPASSGISGGTRPLWRHRRVGAAGRFSATSPLWASGRLFAAGRGKFESDSDGPVTADPAAPCG